MDTNEATTLDAGDAMAAPDTGVAEALSDGDNLDLDTELGTEETAQQAGDDGQDGGEDIEEVELDGKTYQVPHEVRRAILRNEDYTRKTQELAETRRALETQATQFQQASKTVSDKQIDLALVDRQLAAYKALTAADWQAMRREDPDYAHEQQFNFTTLKEQRDTLAAELDSAQRQAALDAERITATRLQEGLQQLSKDIPGFNGELADKLLSFGAETYGFTQQELGEVQDPRLIRLLHAAYTGAQALKQQKAAARHRQSQATAPAATLRGSGGRFLADATTNDFAAFERLADATLAGKS